MKHIMFLNDIGRGTSAAYRCFTGSEPVLWDGVGRMVNQIWFDLGHAYGRKGGVDVES